MVDVTDTTDALIQTGTYIFSYIQYMQANTGTLTVTPTITFTFDSLKCLCSVMSSSDKMIVGE